MFGKIDRYHIKAVLSLRWATYYLAYDPDVERDVVIKMFPPQEARSNVLALHERETAVLASVSHPMFPELYDSVVTDEQVYLVVEYVDGQDLETLITDTGQPIAWRTAVTWLMQLLDGLEYLHTHQPYPIIYRDLKPQNILLGTNGRLRIVDFDTALPLTPDWKPSKKDRVGTVGYAPPEQYYGHSTPQVDIFALGATMHRLLTNTDPCKAPFTFHQRPIADYNSVPPSLARFLQIAVAYEPAKRFPSITVMKEVLTGLALTEVV